MRDIERYTNAYTNDDFECGYQVVYRRKKVMEIMTRYPHRHVLEIGCGWESIAEHCIDFDSYTVVEPSEQFARHAMEQMGSSVEVIQDFFENSVEKLRGRNFDFILISGLLHELDNPEIIMKEVAEIASPDTVIHVNVPNAKSFHRLLAMESGLIQDTHELSQQNRDLQQHRVFDMSSLIIFLRNTFKQLGWGYSVLEQGGYFIKPFSHRQMALCMKYGILDERILDGLYHMAKHIPEMSSEIYVNFCIQK